MIHTSPEAGSSPRLPTSVRNVVRLRKLFECLSLIVPSAPHKPVPSALLINCKSRCYPPVIDRSHFRRLKPKANPHNLDQSCLCHETRLTSPDSRSGLPPQMPCKARSAERSSLLRMQDLAKSLSTHSEAAEFGWTNNCFQPQSAGGQVIDPVESP